MLSLLEEIMFLSRLAAQGGWFVINGSSEPLSEEINSSWCERAPKYFRQKNTQNKRPAVKTHCRLTALFQESTCLTLRIIFKPLHFEATTLVYGLSMIAGKLQSWQ